jgi:D-3-phosphoglycerate dehydrogenase / 2-oxoglutarate reductase
MTGHRPVLFFDRELPEEYGDLVEGRAVAVGPDESDLALAHAVVAGSVCRWNGPVMARAPRLRVISRIGVGYDNVDVVAAHQAGVVVCYTPEAPTVSTAEHTIALMLAITKDLPSSQARARQGLDGSAPTSLELDGRILGLVGFGRIARRVAVAATALGMDVAAHDPYVQGVDASVRLVSFEDLLASADIVSLHVPALPTTYHLISRSALGVMKLSVYLVNCARGSLVDQEALLGALESGHVAGAALDVTDPEPLPARHPLLEHPHVIVTPHVASSTVAGRRRLYAQAIDNALAVLSGRQATTVPTPISGDQS